MMKTVDQISFASNELMRRLHAPSLRFLLHEGSDFHTHTATSACSPVTINSLAKIYCTKFFLQGGALLTHINSPGPQEKLCSMQYTLLPPDNLEKAHAKITFGSF